jgi:hypothetical protein
MADIAKVKRNVAKMVSLNAPESDIDGYIASEGVTIEQVRSFKPEASFLQNVGSDLAQRGAEIESVNKLSRSGQQSELEGTLQTAGAVAGGVGDVVSQGVSSLAETGFEALPEIDQDALKLIGEDVLKSDVGQMGIKALQAGAEAYGAFKQENPRAARNIEAVLNIASLGLVGGGGKVAGKAVIEATPQVVKQGVESAVDLTQQGAQKVTTGASELSGRLVRGRDADKVLASRLPVKEAEAALSQLKGGEILNLADVAGDEIKGLTRAIAKEKGGARNIVKAALDDRNKAALTRITEALSKDISSVDSYFGNLDDIAKARKLASAPLYEEARASGKNLKITTRLNTLLNDQRITSAINEAKSSLGVTLEAKRNSLESLDGAKKVLDDRWRAATRAGENNKAAAIQSLKNNLVQELDRQVPIYKKARAVFSDFATLEDMQTFGRGFDKQTPEQLKMFIKNLNNTEKEAYKIGVRESMMQRAMRAADSPNADIAARIFGSGREGGLKREQLKAVFGEGRQYDAFAKKMAEETAAVDTKFAVLGGSRTDFNLTDDGTFLADVAESAATNGATRTMVDAAVGAIKRRWLGLNPKSAQELAKILTNRELGIKALERLIAETPKAQKAIVRDAVKEIRELKQ